MFGKHKTRETKRKTKESSLISTGELDLLKTKFSGQEQLMHSPFMALVTLLLHPWGTSLKAWPIKTHSFGFIVKVTLRFESLFIKILAPFLSCYS